MIDLLRELVELESPTGETGRIRDRLAGELRSLGAEVSPEAEHLRARAELLGAILRHPGL